MPGKYREGHAGARQRGWPLRTGLGSSKRTDHSAQAQRGALRRARREQRGVRETVRTDHAHQLRSPARPSTQHKFASACNPSCAERRRTTFWTPCVRTRPPRSSTYRQVSKQSLSELRIDRSRQSAPFVSSGSADTQYPDDDIPINDQTDRPDPEDFRVDSCSERAQRTFSSRRLPCRVSCRGVAGAR